jgi:hypothetical protein
MSEEDQLMSKGEIRGWMDTEGYLSSTPPPTSHARISVVEFDREPLETSFRSVRRHGIPCTIYRERGFEFRAEIMGLEEVAKAIKQFGPLGTKKDGNRSEDSNNTSYSPAIKRARAILGL